jgi:hypothetical protein
MRFRKGIGIGAGLVAVTLFAVNSPMTPAPAAKDKDKSGVKQFHIVSNAASSFFTASYSFVDQATTNQIGPGNYAIYAGEGTFGRYTGQGVSQSVPVFENGALVDCTLPDGTSGKKFTLVGHLAITRFDRTGDLLFEKGEPGALNACVSFAAGRFHEEGEVTITGGTGQFAGASGTEKVQVDGGFLQPPDNYQPIAVNLPGIPGAFGFASGVFTMDFTVPKK